MHEFEVNNYDANNFTPPGLIPEFNEWGNHPSDLMAFLNEKIPETYRRVGFTHCIEEGLELYQQALNNLAEKPDAFTGQHMPTKAMIDMFEHWLQIFFDENQISLEGAENLSEALKLANSGANIIISPNHTSPLDGAIALKALRKYFPGTPDPAFVMSQVFEYARVTSLITSGAHKFPVFQPKHIDAFRNKGASQAVTKMQQQNLAAIRSMMKYLKSGGKMLFLYLEKNRNSNGMGIAEPMSIGLLDCMQRASQNPLYILPMNITGVESVFPNQPGVNELDVFWDNIRRGGGIVRCGKPVPFDSVNEATANGQVAEFVLEKQPHAKTEQDRVRSIKASVILGLVAALAPSQELQGIYADNRLPQSL